MSCLLVIDVQNDFLDDGSFAIKNSRSIIPHIRNLLDNVHWDLIVGTRDWHPKNHISFASTQHKDPYTPVTLTDGKHSVESLAWPEHCVQGTYGAEFDPDLGSEKFQVVVSKGTDPNRECFSGFKDVFGAATELNAILQQHQIKTVYVVGVATEYCVKQSVLDSLASGYKTIVLVDCIYGVEKQESAKALDEMRANGAALELSNVFEV